MKHKTGYEVFVVVIQRISEDAFYSFAGIEPYFATEDDQEAGEIINTYFPPDAVDVMDDGGGIIPAESDDDFEGEETEGEDENEAWIFDKINYIE